MHAITILLQSVLAKWKMHEWIFEAKGGYHTSGSESRTHQISNYQGKLGLKYDL